MLLKDVDQLVQCRRVRFAEEVSKTSWGDKSRRYFLEREEEYVGGLKAALGIWYDAGSDGISPTP